MLLLLCTLSAHATDLPIDVLPDEGGAGRSSSGDDGGGKKKDGDGGQGKKGEKRKVLGWTIQPYVSPGGGVQIDASGTSVVAGVDVGVIHRKGKAQGDLYAGIDYTTGSNLSGYDLHAGESMAYKQKYWTAGAGLEFLYNGYKSTDGSFDLDPSAGVAVPVRVKVGPKKYYAFGEVAPALYFAKSRSAGIGPFDELSWTGGAGIRLGGIRAEGSYSQVITARGVISTPALSVTWDGD